MALPYPTKVVLPFDIATAQDMNERHANDVALAAGTGLDDGAVTPDKISLPYKFSVYRGTTQTVSANTWTKVQLASVTFDTGSNFDSTTNYQFTAPVAGFYQFSACVGSAAVPDGGRLAVGINVNTFSSAPTYIGDLIVLGASQTAQVNMSKFIRLQAGDTVQLYGFSAATNISAGVGTTYFEGYLIAES